MRAIDEFDEVISGSRAFDEVKDNSTILRAYEHTQKAGNERLDFDDGISLDDIKQIANTLKRLGLREFTISVRQSNLTDVLAAFQEQGVFIKGIVPVKVYWSKNRVVSAILLEIR